VRALLLRRPERVLRLILAAGRESESLHKAAGPGAKVTWLETDHYFRGVNREDVCNTMIDFVEKSVPAKKDTPK